MLGRIIPREEKFFDHFRKASELIVEGSQTFIQMLGDLQNAEHYAKKIQDIEQAADVVAHHIIELLHKTFITPLDREDIYQLICRMDDIIDFIEAASERIHLFGITSLPAHAMELAQVCLRSCQGIAFIVSKLENLKDAEQILRSCVEINSLENEADQILRVALASLFKNEPNAVEIIKLKEIYELLETVTDRCEDVANIVEGIVLEYS